MGSSWVSVAINQMASVLRRKGQKTERRRPCEDAGRDGEIRAMHLKAKEHQGCHGNHRKLGERHEIDSFSENPNAVQTLILISSLKNYKRITFYCFSDSICANSLQQP